MSIGLSLVNVSRTFQGPSGPVQAVEEASFEVAPSEFVALVGPSGCGKSTILRAVAGLDTGYTGDVLADGVRVTGPDLSRGVVFQEPRLFPWLSTAENVGFGLPRGSNDRAVRVRELLSLVGLTGFERAYSHQLSGGMAQRAAIARALAPRPDVLLLDEPFGALDAFTRIRLQDALQEIWLAQRVYRLDHGAFAPDLATLEAEQLIEPSIRMASTPYAYAIDAADTSSFTAEAVRNGSTVWSGGLAIDQDGTIGGAVSEQGLPSITPGYLFDGGAS